MAPKGGKKSVTPFWRVLQNLRDVGSSPKTRISVIDEHELPSGGYLTLCPRFCCSFLPKVPLFAYASYEFHFSNVKKKLPAEQCDSNYHKRVQCRSGQAAAYSACSASARESYSKHFKPQTRAHEWCRLTSGESPPHTTSRHTRARLHCLRKSQKEVKMLLFFKIFTISSCFTLAKNLYSNPVFNLNAAIQATKKEHCETFERRLGTEA